jgi:SAM-dependent methyltransferase
VDVVHDVERFPWPLPDAHFTRILCSHLVEHLDPRLTVRFMDECWRVCEPGGWLFVITPYAGSFGFWQDPTHTKAWNEATPAYFDPAHELYRLYTPSPWTIIKNAWHSNGNLEVVFQKPVVQPARDGRPRSPRASARHRDANNRRHPVRVGRGPV